MFLFHSTVLRLTEITPDTFRIRLSCPENFVRQFIPGQFVMVSVAGPSHLDPLLKRPFSICRLRSDGFELLIKVVGRGTEMLRHMAIGTLLSLHGPLGNGYPVKIIKNDSRIMLVAGGIGIASIISLLDYCLETAYPLKNINLILGARTSSELLYIDEFRQLVEKGLSLSIATDDGSVGHYGLVTDLISRQLQDVENNPIIFSCGPMPMLTALGKLAMEASCPCYLSLESRMACGFGVCLGCVTRKKTKDEKHPWVKVCQDGPVFDVTTLML
ncbi:MAG: dihydroorotate dehydrogenase electron transfer subunit [Pseudomonadota bacterium]|nr:dihydroorotate dehydrogenase electron transfer subunit [Pseudomonadota bacterium]